MLSSDQQQDRPPRADHLADLDQHVDLDQRHHHEGDEQQPGPAAGDAALIAAHAVAGPAHAPAHLAARARAGPSG